MVDPQLSQYVSNARAKNIPNVAIRENLLKAGWPEAAVDEALSPAPPTKDIPVPSKLMSPVELLRTTWKLFRSRLATLIILGFLPSLIGFVAGIGIGLGSLLFMNPLNLVGSGGFDFSKIWIYIGLALVLLLLTMILVTWSSVAQLTAITSQHPIGVRQSFAHAWKFIRSFWWLSFIMGMVILGGFMLFVVPGIIYAVWFSFAYFILVDEEYRGLRAMIRSREYARGLWWPILGRLLIPLLIAIPLGILNSIIKDDLNLPALSGFLNLVFSLLGAPLLLCYNYVVFDNVRSYKAHNVPDPMTQKRYPYVIVGLLGLLLTFGMPVAILLAINPAKQISNARNSQAKSELMNLRRSLEFYQIDNYSYPQSLTDLVPKYHPKLPSKGDAIEYTYKVTSEGDAYTLCVQPEGSPSMDNCYTSPVTTPRNISPTDQPYVTEPVEYQ